MKYLIDSNIFIQSKTFEYHFGYCEIFWDMIIELAKKKVICSINTVKREIICKKDELEHWVNNKLLVTCPSFFEDETSSISDYAKIINWVNNQPFYENAKREFAEYSRADAHIIAHALKNNYTIITAEKFKPDAKKRVLIPNVAKNFHIPTITLFEFLGFYAGHNFSIK